MGNAPKYRAIYEERIAEARAELAAAHRPDEKLAKAKALTRLYLLYQNDSALVYNAMSINLALQEGDENQYIRLLCEKALLYGHGGLVNEGTALLDSILRDSRVQTPELRRMVFEYYFDVNDFIYHYSRPVDLHTKNVVRLNALRDSLYIYSPKQQDQAMHTNVTYVSPRELIDSLTKVFNASTHDGEKAVLAIILANRYNGEGMHEERDLYWIISATLNIRNARMDNQALVYLGQAMLASGDWSRAEKYLNLAYDQALFYNSRSRLVMLAPSMKKLSDREHQHAERLSSYCMWAAILCTCLIAFTIVVVRKAWKCKRQCSMEISRMENEQAKVVNRATTDSKHIEAQSDALRRFMNISIDAYFEFLHLRNMVVRKLKNKDVTDLLQQLTTEGEVTKAQKNLLRRFDIAFTRLYPNFVEQVNALMRPDAQLAKSENEILSTEMRLLALWRLGVTEAGRVAIILSLSVNTVYFYRNKIRAGAIDRDHLHEQIMGIKNV